MKTFRRIQALVAILAIWTGIAISDSSEATGKEIFTSVVLVALAVLVIASVLIERTKDERKAE